LGHNPVAIQNWVRNTIEWVPTWGAIQSAQDTLDKQRGNAVDIASLQIALLRAGNIPARYQFGTVELPAGNV
jgi:transglutaminase-like putative cysteine protease